LKYEIDSKYEKIINYIEENIIYEENHIFLSLMEPLEKGVEEPENEDE